MQRSIRGADSRGAAVAATLPRAGRRSICVSSRKRADIGGETLDLAVIEQSLEAWHDRLIARDDIAFGLQDRVSDIGVVCLDRSPVRELHAAAIEAVEARRMHVGGDRVAPRTALRHEQL